MAKKKETYGKPCGLFPGDIVMCWGISPQVLYVVESTRPRIGEKDLVEMQLWATLSSKPSFMQEKHLVLDASHVVKLNPEIVVKHVRRLSNDMQILIAALEKQQNIETQRCECPLKLKKKTVGSPK